jgi:hypothetical protein
MAWIHPDGDHGENPVAIGKVHDIWVGPVGTPPVTVTKPAPIPLPHVTDVEPPNFQEVMAGHLAKMTEAFKKIDMSALKEAFAKIDAGMKAATPAKMTEEIAEVFDVPLDVLVDPTVPPPVPPSLVDKWYGIKYPAGHVPEFDPEEHVQAVNPNGMHAQHGSHLGDDIGMMRMSCPDCRALWNHRWALVTIHYAAALTDLGIGKQLRDKIIKALDEADTATKDVVG